MTAEASNGDSGISSTISSVTSLIFPNLFLIAGFRRLALFLLTKKNSAS